LVVMRVRRWFLGGLAAGGCGLLLSGCSLPFFGPSAQELATGAYQSLNSAGTVHVTGQFTARSKAYVVDLVVQPKLNGQATGSGSYGGAPFRYLAAGSATYLAGQRFWQSISGDPKTARGYGEKWVVATSENPVVAALVTLNDLGGTKSPLKARAAAMRKGNETTIDGTRVALLTDGETTYYVSESSPMRVLRLQLGSGRTTSEGLSKVKLDLGYGGSKGIPGAPAAGQFIDPSDPSTLPALYKLVDASGLQSCDESSCGFTATVQNDDGAPEGQTVATLSLYKDDHTTLIGDCQTPVPALQHGQSGQVTCRISGPTYAAFYASIPPGGRAPVYKDVTFKNPPYDA
jgi:hypothetical protein